jgi:hypothetical protein
MTSDLARHNIWTDITVWLLLELRLAGRKSCSQCMQDDENCILYYLLVIVFWSINCFVVPSCFDCGIPIRRVSCVQVGKNVLLGSTALEESAAVSLMHVSVNSKGQVCGLLKGGKALVDVFALQHMITAAQRKANAIILALQQPLDDQQ